MTKQENFLEEITTNFTELYVEVFTDKYFQNFNSVTFEKDFAKSLSILDKKLKDRFKRKIDKIKVVHYK